jgi:UDP-glucose 4-epimerase
MYLVTGGNGFIGSHMARYLVENGHQVVILDNWSTSVERWVFPQAINVKGDIADQELVKSLFDQYDFKGVFHFAGKALVGESEQHPFFYYQENIIKGLQFFQAVTEKFNGPLVFSSTCASFGIPEHSPISEENHQNPINAYGRSKLIVEHLLRDLARLGKLNVTVLRYFNAAGCSADHQLGEIHDPETHLIPRLCLNFLKGDKKAIIFGNQFETRDGTCIRDYIHVLDLAEAHWLAMKAMEQKQGFFDYNLGTEQGQSVLEVIKTFERVVGESIEKEFTDPRAGDPAALVSDSQKAYIELGFKAKYDLFTCIDNTFHFLKKYYVDKKEQ